MLLPAILACWEFITMYHIFEQIQYFRSTNVPLLTPQHCKIIFFSDL